MKAKKPKDKKERNSGSVRASISFPRDVYQTINEIAAQKKVSLAWVVREAVERYIADKWPLFRHAQRDS